MKPLGMPLRVGEQGIALSVSVPSRAEDLVWEAVEEARAANWDFARFVREAKEGWAQSLRDEAKDVERFKS